MSGMIRARGDAEALVTALERFVERKIATLAAPAPSANSLDSLDYAAWRNDREAARRCLAADRAALVAALRGLLETPVDGPA